MEDSINEKLLEKLKLYSNFNSDSTETLRTVTARLHSRTTSHDKQIREKTLFQIRKKKDNVLQTFLSLLESVDDHASMSNIAGIVRECISPKAGIARFSVLRQLIELNGSHTFIKLLIQLHVNDTHIADPFLHELIWILGQLSQKDPKFSGKIRQLNALPAFHFYLKLFYQHNSKLVIPLLMVIKSVAKNNNLLTILIKDGITATMEKIIFGINVNPSTKLKLLLNIFSYLSKNGHFCSRIIKAGVVPVFLKIFSRWEKYDGKTRLKICNDTIVTLQHICSSKQGRSAVRRENGFTPLYKFCLSCPEDKIYDRLLTKVCAIINVCLQKKELPLCSPMSPAQFPLPIDVKKDHYELDSDDSDDEDDSENDEDSNNDSGEGEVSLKSRTDMLKNDPEPPPVPTTIYRNASDLEIYRKMFSEYYFFFYNGKCDADVTLSITDNIDVFNNNDSETNLKFDQNSNVDRYENIANEFVKRNCGISILNELENCGMSQRTAYCKIASKIRSILPFIKVAYPDVMGGDGIGILQPLYVKDRKICRSDQTLYASIDALNVHNYSNRYLKRFFQKRSKLVTGIDHHVSAERIYNNVIYDLDKLLCSQASKNLPKKLTNTDETRIGVKEFSSSTLMFESRFESGNLRKAIQTGPREYDLILTPDVNSSHHCQWFYFEISNMDNMAPYTFNIVNCEKTNSQFNYGMKPLMYSVRESTLGRPGWFRTGSDICYYRNGYKIPHCNKKTFLTASFSIKFPHSLDVCYIAYTFPYTYSQLLTRMKKWISNAEKDDIYLRVDNLCNSLNNNPVPLLTITAPDSQDNRTTDREIAFLTSRIHPGEANSSWVIDGVISYLLSSSSNAEKLRNQFVFKIVPMLNVEGVLNGCHRCGLTDEDLNRKWSLPNPQLHPSIYHTKGLLEYCTKVLRKSPYIFCDFHGHSRKKNVFLFGCSNQESWLESDRNLPNVGIEHLLLPHLMENCSPAFSSELCNYRVERSRESTARVTVWREFGVRRSYTMETSYCGCDQGPYKGFHLDTIHLQEIGSNFCTALACLYDDRKWRIEMLLSKQDGNSFRLEHSLAIKNNSSSFSSLEFTEDSDQSKENYYSSNND
ncbi:cytosolic carboxypeptidase 1-like isoform X3 [Planococcus citri]|uniref:cytosolic carboxypeptidase 1-like isoform X3 n=1 Tax=Planococcus citri TaxID=170843 RepID=UPI0031F881B7